MSRKNITTEQRDLITKLFDELKQLIVNEYDNAFNKKLPLDRDSLESHLKIADEICEKITDYLSVIETALGELDTD